MTNEPCDDTIEALLRRQFEGPVADAGFSARVMRQLPPRRQRIAWPLWLGLLTGATACGLCLADAPMLRAGWRDWLAGAWSIPVVGTWLAILGLSWLALGWAMAESRAR